MATHSSVPAWRIPWMEKPVGLCPWGHKESDTTEPTNTSTNLYFRCGLHLKGGWAGSHALFHNCVDKSLPSHGVSKNLKTSWLKCLN